MDFPEELLSYVREDDGMVIRFLEGCVVEKGLNCRDLWGKIAMEVIEIDCVGEVGGLVIGREDPAGVASNFLAGVNSIQFQFQ